MPKIDIFVHFGPGLAGSFGALLVGWLVVVARGLYHARHLFTLYETNLNGLRVSYPGETKTPEKSDEVDLIGSLNCLFKYLLAPKLKSTTFLLDNWPGKRIGEGHQETSRETELVIIRRFKGFRIKRQVQSVVHSIQEMASWDPKEFFI